MRLGEMPAVERGCGGGKEGERGRTSDGDDGVLLMLGGLKAAELLDELGEAESHLELQEGEKKKAFVSVRRQSGGDHRGQFAGSAQGAGVAAAWRLGFAGASGSTAAAAALV